MPGARALFDGPVTIFPVGGTYRHTFLNGSKLAAPQKDKDLKELVAIENIQGVRLDVNKQEQIDAAVKIITEAGRGQSSTRLLHKLRPVLAG